MSNEVLIEALEKIRDRKLPGEFVIRDCDIARAALDAYRRNEPKTTKEHR